MLILTLLALTLFTLAVWYDMRAFTIPNRLTLSFFCLGVIANAIVLGLSAAGLALLTGLGVFVVMFPLFAWRLIGAGDVKLMMAIGAIMGAIPTFHTLVWGIIFGSVMAIGFGACKVGLKGIRETFVRYYYCLTLRMYVRPTANELGSVSVPYAPALALGFIYTCVTTPELRNSLEPLLSPLKSML